MTRPKESRSLGILTKYENDFLFMTKDKRKEKYGEGTRKYYQRIVKSANQGFQDYSIMIKHLPERYRAEIWFLQGLRDIKMSLRSAGESKQIPDKYIDDALYDLKQCLDYIKREYNERLNDIAKQDFDKVEQWLQMIQKYPKPKGAKL